MGGREGEQQHARSSGGQVRQLLSLQSALQALSFISAAPQDGGGKPPCSNCGILRSEPRVVGRCLKVSLT